MRRSYEESLHSLESEMEGLAEMVDVAIVRSIDALGWLDSQLARQVVAADQEINAKRYAIEEKAVGLIATQQPVASDLRLIVAILNIIVDLERMGDHAEGIAKIALLHGDKPLLKPLIDLPRMAELSRAMLRDSLRAFSTRDIELAQRVATGDDEVDALNDHVYRELITYMLADPTTIDRATYLIWASHNLERIADRTTNICERVLYLVTGSRQEMQVSSY